MFNFFNRSAPRYPTIRQALVGAGMSAAADATKVALVERPGNYSGRRVNFFHAVEPGHEDLPLVWGHVEHDGIVVFDRWSSRESVAPVRVPANRANHPDDEPLLLWDAGAARSSAAKLSVPAATWLRAQTNSESQR